MRGCLMTALHIVWHYLQHWSAIVMKKEHIRGSDLLGPLMKFVRRR